ncbi:MAG: hypothetical protein HN617_11950 [Planctomycetaceae bacterium]|jgi:hypothetical protein|nr:hypothetical protein [Planctomycetaceae bacterium]MBT4013746.1 hypothetical protein [Planctomycetaceae bacterium]MBT4726694.1 hypothetical protein [Planctomycetaceae bacterium]MBT5125079.1 hypothetical protein [Planctomycetaceae bacterium]MBT5597386.1 hypothetical protein [Planctomycetaceae bacterium]
MKNLRIVVSVFCLAAFGIPQLFHVNGVEKDQIQRDYVPGSVLSKDQEKVVIQLAAKRGIKQVAKLSTYNLYPTQARGIRVQGVEQVKGREVSTQVLNVTYKKWWHPNAEPKEDDLQIGEYWAGKPRAQKEIILKVDKKEYRTRTIQGLTMQEAESMLGLLLTKNYIIEPAVNQANFEKIAWENPMGFRKRGENFSISFPHVSRGAGFFDLQIQIKDKELVIQQMFQAVP